MSRPGSHPPRSHVCPLMSGRDPRAPEIRGGKRGQSQGTAGRKGSCWLFRNVPAPGWRPGSRGPGPLGTVGRQPAAPGVPDSDTSLGSL